MPSVERDREIRRRKRRKAKRKQLLARLATARDNKERERLTTRLRKRSMNVEMPQK